MSSMEKFKTRAKASVPIRTFLFDPATMKKTDDWLDIRSSLSDEFMEARDRSRQAGPEIGAITDDAARKERVKLEKLKMNASLVAGWSFEEPLTEENIINFLREAPQIQNLIVEVADDATSFFGKDSKSSSSGQRKK